MIQEKRSKSLISLIMALLIMGITNHCAFENLFSSFTKIVFDAKILEHSLNHLGHNFPHKHNDSPRPHEHGQPHSLIAFRFEKTAYDFLTLLETISSLSFIAIYALGFTVIARAHIMILPFTTGDPPGPRNFISSLTLAPQAPPIPMLSGLVSFNRTFLPN